MSARKYYILVVFGLLFLNSGCNRKNKIPETMLSGNGVIAADESLKPLMNAELDVFHSIYQYARVECNYVSEYDAINLILQEKIRLAIVSRPLNESEIEYLKNKKIVPESIPFAYDAIAVIVHPANKLKAVTTRQLAQILSGNVLDWSQVKGSEMSGTIKQVFDTESSGIIRSLNDSLKLNKKISGNISFAGNNSKVIESVTNDPNAIGFVGFNWISENDNTAVQATLKKINLLGVSSAAFTDSTNSFRPTLGTMFNLVYPLTRRVYAIYTDPAASLARGFLAHLTSERGQKIIYRDGLKPEFDFQRLVKIKNE